MIRKNIVERDRPKVTIWRMFIAWGIPKVTNTHSEYVIIIALQATMVARTRLNVTFYVHSLSPYSLFPSSLWKWSLL